MKVTNISKALQGVNTKSGRAFIRPGETREIEFDEAGLKQARRLKGLLTLGKGPVEVEAMEPSGAKTPAEILAMAEDGTPFMSFKSAASKLLGDNLPTKKDEIVLALMELTKVTA